MVDLVKPSSLQPAPTVFDDDAMVVDAAGVVRKATPVQVVNAGAPVATQAEAIAGANNTKRMTPLTTKQVLDNVTAPSVARAQAWAESPTNPDPAIPDSRSSKSWAEDAEAARDETVNAAPFAVKDAADFFSRTELVKGARYWSKDGLAWDVLASGTGDFVVAGAQVNVVISETGLDPRALGSPANGIDDDAPYVEKAFTLSDHVNLSSGLTYVFASVIGVPDQSLYSSNVRRLTGWGASVVLDGVAAGDDIITSASAKISPNSTSNLFTGKFDVVGIQFTQRSASVLINGDRVYNIFCSFNHFQGVNSVARSYRNKGASYPNGYMQSVYLTHNHFISMVKIIDAKRCFNFRWALNFAEACQAGIYIDGPGDAAVNSFVMRDGLFEGGGMAFRLGKVIGGIVSGVYMEGNTLGDVPSEKCYGRIGVGGLRSGGFRISGCTMQGTSSQISDVDFVYVKDDAGIGVSGSISYSDNFFTGTRLFESGRAFHSDANVGGTGFNDFSRAPKSPEYSRVGWRAARQSRLRSTYFTPDNPESPNGVGKFSVADITVGLINSNISLDNRRNAVGQIELLLNHITAGGVQCGVDFAVIDFVLMSASSGISSGAVNDSYISFSLRNFINGPVGQPIETVFNNTTKSYFTSPSLTVTRSGDVYSLSLSGYDTTGKNLVNFGSPNRIETSMTLKVSAINPSNGETTSMITPSGGIYS